MPARPGEPIALETVPARSSTMAWQTLDGEMVLLSLKGKEMLGLNPVAGKIWSLIDGARSVRQIAEAVTNEFEVGGEQAETDVKTFVTELWGLGAVDVKQ